MPPKQAVKEIQEKAGTQFSKRMADAFLTAFHTISTAVEIAETPKR
jgi:HD-GYP domain-containing protein (c-di-GMP phosphodiesterase class II)